MNTLAFYLLIFILIFTMGKWITFIIVCPLIRLFNKHNRTRSLETSNNDQKQIENNEYHLSDNIGDDKTIKKCKNAIFSFFNGYERYMMIQTGFIPSHTIRDIIYKKIFLVRMDSKAIIYYGAEIRGAYNLILKKGAVIGDRCVLDARRGGIIVGENVQLGNSVCLWTGSHNYNDPYFRSTAQKRGPITIGNRSWIGPGATILHSVNIGEGAVIAAGAVVTKDVEPFSIVAGIPAKKIGIRNSTLKYEFTSPPIPFY